MAKVKVSKKSTRIDMTAMCDVAFLLLTFFILSATAKEPEPHPVDTPASTVLDKLPESGVATITVGDKKVFFNIPDKDVKIETLKRISQEYNVNFTETEYEAFGNMQGFGVPLNQLRGLLRMSPADRNEEGLQTGIPYDTVNDQLTSWVKQAREASKAILEQRMIDGEDVKFKDLDIAIKGDADEEYPTIKRVIDILQDQKKNRFFLVTGLRNEDFLFFFKQYNMAELNTGGDSGGKGGKVRSKKSNPAVDLTAMVDLAFLLITFFMLTTSLSKPQSMPLAMPDKDINDQDTTKTKVPEERLMTILIGKDDALLWYVGKFDEFIIEPTETVYGKDGIRQVLLEQIARAKAYVRREQGKPDEHLIVNIKASDKASYRDLVDILDEMAITDPQLYAIGDITEPEVKLLEEKGLY